MNGGWRRQSRNGNRREPAPVILLDFAASPDHSPPQSAERRKRPYGEGRNAGISGGSDRAAPQRHLQGETRERSRDQRPDGGTDAQEPDQGACRRQGSGRDDAL